MSAEVKTETATNGSNSEDAKVKSEAKPPQAAAAAAAGDTQATNNGGGDNPGPVQAKPEEQEPGAETAEADASLLRKLLHTRLVETTQAVEIERQNPESPLYSAKTFEELNLKPELLQGIYAMGFTKPSKVQETALPTLINNPPQNLIAQSQSGTGKTAAFTLAMLSRVNTSLNHTQALCLAPTLELALQIADVVSKMGQFLNKLTISLAVKGTRVERNVPLSNQVVIGTPGTVLDWSFKLNVLDLRKIKAFVLDEADIMIAQQGHQDFCTRIVRGLDRNCQMMLFSATYNNDVMQFALKIVKDPVIIRLRRQEESLNYIKQFYHICDNAESKFKAVYDLLGLLTVGQAIVFCQTRKTASDLAIRLNSDGIPVELLSGELDVEQRAAVIERFREGKAKILVTTNVTARGIDIEEVSMVVNFDLPVDQRGVPEYETYLHRIGRTGRFGKTGIAINLIDRYSMTALQDIQKHFGNQIKNLDLNDPEQIEKLANSK